jgi:hypothetical protein
MPSARLAVGVIRCDAGATYRFGATLRLDDVRHLTIDGARSRWEYTGTGTEAISLRRPCK